MRADLVALGWKPLEQRGGGFEELVGPLYARRTDAGVRFGFRAEPKHANPRGMIHGGMLMTLVDHALGAMVWHAVGRRFCATVSLNCDFVAAAKVGDWIEAVGEISRKGHSLIFVHGELMVGDKLVVSANGVWKLLGAA